MSIVIILAKFTAVKSWVNSISILTSPLYFLQLQVDYKTNVLALRLYLSTKLLKLQEPMNCRSTEINEVKQWSSSWHNQRATVQKEFLENTFQGMNPVMWQMEQHSCKGFMSSHGGNVPEYNGP